MVKTLHLTHCPAAPARSGDDIILAAAYHDTMRIMPLEQLGTVLKISLYCTRNSTGNRIPGAAAWSERDWLLRVGLDSAPAPASWWCYEGDDFVLSFTPLYRLRNKQAIHEQRVANGRKGAEKRWGKKMAKTHSKNIANKNSKMIANENSKMIANGNTRNQHNNNAQDVKYPIAENIAPAGSSMIINSPTGRLINHNQKKAEDSSGDAATTASSASLKKDDNPPELSWLREQFAAVRNSFNSSHHE